MILIQRHKMLFRHKECEKIFYHVPSTYFHYPKEINTVIELICSLLGKVTIGPDRLSL